MSFGGWRVALRLAWRQARRHRLRALAIVATLAVPVAVVTGLDVVTRSTHLSRVEQLDRQLGGAQAIVQWSGFGPLVQAPDPEAGEAQPVSNRLTPDTGAPAPASLPPSLVPSGATVVGEADAFSFFVTDRGGDYVEVRGVDLHSSATAALVVIKSGHIPDASWQLALSPAAAAQLHAGLGTVVRVPGQSTQFRVVGIVAERYSPGDSVAFSEAAAAVRLQGNAGARGVQAGISQWFISSPHPVAWADVEAFNARGWTVTSRAVVLHPPPRRDVPYFAAGTPTTGAAPIDHQTVEVGAGLLGAMLLLEVVLLAGPAFAVGARRRRHELAVMAATGAARRHLVAVVAADGLLLGAVAAVAGAGVGVGAGAAVLAGLRAWTNRVPGSVTVRGWEILGIAALAVVSGLFAALLPALAAGRADTAQVLRGRQRLARLSWRPALAGLAALGVAAGLGFSKLHETSNGGVPVPLILAAALAELGFVLLTPAALGLAGRAANHLPLWPRLALRNTSRNRSAASPAVAAVVAVVAAVVVALIYGTTLAAHDRASWLPGLPVGDATADLQTQNVQPGVDRSALAVVRADLPGATVVELHGSTGGRQAILVAAASPGCPLPQIQFQDDGGFSFSSIGGDCPATEVSSGNVADFLVDDGTSMPTLLGGPAGRQAETALQSGKVVVFDSSVVVHGMVTLILGPGKPSSATLPAVAVQSPVVDPAAAFILPPADPARLGLSVGPEAIYVKDAAAQPAAEFRATNTALAQLGIDGLYVQAPYHDGISPALLAVTGGDLLLTLLATVAATVLVSVDGAEDTRILAAVGAAPGGQRRLAFSRAGFICGVGTVFGVLAGLLPGVAIVWRVAHQQALEAKNIPPGSFFDGSYPLHIPWAKVAAIVVLAPLLAATVAAAITRPRAWITRRAS